MKSHALKDVVIGLYRSLLKDLCYIDPTIHGEVEMVSRLDSLFQSRGLPVFTLAFPDLCKFLEKGLATGRLPDIRPPLGGRKSSEDARPALLHAMWSLVFDVDGMLLPTPNADAIAGLRQLLLFAKKLRLECSKEKVGDTLIEFLEVDESLPRSFPGTWDADAPHWSDRHGHPLWGEHQSNPDQSDLYGRETLPERRPFKWAALRLLSGMVLSSFGSFEVWKLKPKHGPGAVADSVAVKHELPHWPLKLAQVFPADWFASHDLCDRTVTTKEFPSRVLCVPKTQKGPRIIAAEPTSHQWCQGAIERWLRSGIERSHIQASISLSDQKPSQVLALEASLTGELATVDLSAASDRLSTRLVEYLFQSRRDVLDALHATRTRSFVMPDGSLHVARKFACMGSACTFPVQTIVFTILSIWAVLITENAPITVATVRNASKRVRVFGDDIILPTSAYETVIDLLTEVGLKVNTAKSFGTGWFRESCGLDAYHGVDVTPAYFLQAYSLSNPESLVSVVATSNNFHRKGYWHAAEWLLNTIDPKVVKNLRIASRDVSQPCLFSYAPDEKHLKMRFNPTMHTLEVKALTIAVKSESVQGNWNASLLQFHSERGDKPLLDVVLWDDRTVERQIGQARQPKTRLSLGWVLKEDRV